VKLRHRFFVAMVLFPALLLAQSAATAPKQPASTTASPGSFPVMSAAAQARARQLYGYFESGQSAQLFAAFSPEMKKAGTSAKVAALAKDVAAKLGREEAMLGENFAPDLLSMNTVYSRFSRFTKIKDPLFIVIVVNPQGQVAMLQPRPAPQAPASRYSDYKVQTKLKLPFPGEWFVYQGGRDIYQNAYAYREAERYAVDFIVLKDGLPYSGDGTKNEQFYCYGQPVAAPADGTVVMVIDSFTDNMPGRPEQVMPTGNRVLIAHGNQEYSLLMHLKQHSIKVKNGAKVKQGDIVAECGNSGASAAPHLEYRLQNSKGRPYPFTLPAAFVDYVANAKPVPAGEPVRGQFVHNSGENAAVATEKQ
jgi:peptidase M23-like protein